MFGIRLRLLRCLAGLTQAQLGEKLHITASALGMYEQGRRLPSLSTIVEISEVFEVSCDFLLGGSALSDKEEYMEMMVLMFAMLAQRMGKGVRGKGTVLASVGNDHLRKMEITNSKYHTHPRS